MLVESIIKPLRPSSKEWQFIHRISPEFTFGYPVEGWFHPDKNLQVMSAVEVAKDNDSIDRGPEYHISVSKKTAIGPQRCSQGEAQWALKQFGLEGAEEDNHVPGGKVRNFWRTIAEPLIGIECKCKDEETAIVEDDYEWRPVKN